MRISGVFVYPLKSAAGIALHRAELDDFGFRYDRRWMVITGDGQFVTQREEPRLALVRTALDADSLRLEVPGTAPLRLPLRETSGSRRAVRIWRDDVAAVDVGDDAARWISHAIGQDARIVHMPDDSVRPVDPGFSIDGERVAFPDAFPLLLISQASLDGLNARLEVPLPMNRFRPNLVVEGTDAHAEDEWRRIRIGSVDFAAVKPCARCVTTTVDQETGQTGKEPLRTLATYRKRGSNVMFGQNLIHLGRGEVKIDDEVEVLSGPGFEAENAEDGRQRR